MTTVLVVDDDPIICRFMRLALELDGLHVITSLDGGEAVELLAKPEPVIDVLVTDYRLPSITGLDVVTVARRIDPGLPCIMVTGTAEFDVAVRAMSAGAINYLVKPFASETLRVVVARAIERRRLTEEAMRLRVVVPLLERFTMTLADVVEARDVETHAHCQRLVAMADRIAERLEMSGDDRQSVRLGACLHDVGKIAVPDAVLHKRGALLPDEWEKMRRHPELGASLLDGIEQWAKAKHIVRHHHERFDGTGYPDGLVARQIPLGARIVAVSDAADAMLFGRRYAAARSPEQVVAEVQRERGRQFDPDVADAFLAMAGTDGELDEVLAGGRVPAVSLTL
jgi:putative two-component system response regulator